MVSHYVSLISTMSFRSNGCQHNMCQPGGWEKQHVLLPLQLWAYAMTTIRSESCLSLSYNWRNQVCTANDDALLLLMNPANTNGTQCCADNIAAHAISSMHSDPSRIVCCKSHDRHVHSIATRRMRRTKIPLGMVFGHVAVQDLLTLRSNRGRRWASAS